MLVCIFVTVIFVPEKKFVPEKIPEISGNVRVGCWKTFLSKKNPIVGIFGSIWRMPPDLRRVCVVQFFGWFKKKI
jgi:hypothetical protein